MHYINLDTLEYPVSEAQIRALFPTTSFPTPFSAEGFAPVVPSPLPAYNPYVERAEEAAPELVNGVYEQRWSVVALAQEDADLALAGAREARWRQIQDIRDRRFQQGFPLGAYWFHSDGNSKIQHLANKDTARDMIANGAAMSDPLVDPTTASQIIWKTMSGEFVPLTIQLAYDIVDAAKAFEFSIFSRAEVLRATVNGTPDPYSVDIGAGWPAVFGE